MDKIDTLLTRVKTRARGWMPVPVYRGLYESAAQGGNGPIVEIGTFCGAATVAMALGAATSGKPRQIITADILHPKQGLQGASVAAKIDALEATFAHFGVAAQFVHGRTEELVAAQEPHNISLLLLDGGGRLETDLALLWDRLDPECLIIIDDIDGAVTAQRRWRTVDVNQKHRISKLLTDRFVDAGLLIQTNQIQSTGWYRKGCSSSTADEIRLMALPAYHEVVRVSVAVSEVSLALALARRVAARVPWLRRLYHFLRGR